MSYIPDCVHINMKRSERSSYLFTLAHLRCLGKADEQWRFGFETQGATVRQYVPARWKNSSWKQDEGALFQMSRCIFMAAAECFLLYKHRASTPPSQTLLRTSHDQEREREKMYNRNANTFPVWPNLLSWHGLWDKRYQTVMQNIFPTSRSKESKNMHFVLLLVYYCLPAWGVTPPAHTNVFSALHFQVWKLADKLNQVSRIDPMFTLDKI